MNLFDIPVSALRASQAGMAAVSGNLANATTPGSVSYTHLTLPTKA